MDSQTDLEQRLDIRETLAVLTRGWLFIVVATVTFFVIGLAASFIYPKHYEASIKLVLSTAQSSTDRLSSIASGLGGDLGSLMSFAGLSVSSNSDRAEALATLQSEVLTERYIATNDLLPVLFRRYWNAGSKRWSTTDPDKMPTLWKGNRLFVRKIRTVSEDARSGVVTMTIKWTDPILAARWANGLVKLSNDYLRDRAISDSDRSISYLDGQIAKTNVVELRSALYALMENEIKKEMLARGNEEYAFKVVDPAEPPELASYPRPMLWAALSAISGLLLSILVILVKHSSLRD